MLLFTVLLPVCTFGAGHNLSDAEQIYLGKIIEGRSLYAQQGRAALFHCGPCKAGSGRGGQNTEDAGINNNGHYVYCLNTQKDDHWKALQRR